MKRYLFFLLMLGGIASAQEPCEQLMVSRPFFHLVENSAGQKVGYLLGTMHVGTSLSILPSQVREAIDTATDITIEFASDSLLIKLYLGLLGVRWSGLPLSKLISPESMAQIVEMTGAPAALFDRMKPTLAAAIISSLLVKNDPDFQTYPKSGLDEEIKALAKSKRLPIESLDSFWRARKMIQSISAPENLAGAISRVSDMEQFKKEFRKLIDSYYAGDDEALVRILAGSSKTFREDLLVARNVLWMKKIIQQYSKPGIHLIAVGAGHLYGQEGVIELLRKEGFVVTRFETSNTMAKVAN